MAGFVAVAAGVIMPGVADSIKNIFTKIAEAITTAAGSATTAIAETSTATASTGSNSGDVRIICAVMAILFLGIIVLPRKKNMEE